MRNYNKAFSLIELIAVITVLAILITLASLSYGKIRQDAAKSPIISDIAAIEGVLASSSLFNDTNYRGESILLDANEILIDVSGNRVNAGTVYGIGRNTFTIAPNILASELLKKDLNNPLSYYIIDDKNNCYYKDFMDDTTSTVSTYVKMHMQ